MKVQLPDNQVLENIHNTKLCKKESSGFQVLQNAISSIYFRWNRIPVYINFWKPILLCITQAIKGWNHPILTFNMIYPFILFSSHMNNIKTQNKLSSILTTALIVTFTTKILYQNKSWIKPSKYTNTNFPDYNIIPKNSSQALPTLNASIEWYY